MAYSLGLLIKEQSSARTKGDTVYYRVTAYTYDRQGNKIEEAYGQHPVMDNKLSVEEDNYIKLHYANVTVLDNDTGEAVFSIKNEYRAFDFRWGVWENETYNFWLKSGNIGTFYYEFQSDNKT